MLFIYRTTGSCGRMVELAETFGDVGKLWSVVWWGFSFLLLASRGYSSASYVTEILIHRLASAFGDRILRVRGSGG